MTRTGVPCIFFDLWVMFYGASSYRFTENATKIFRKCFGTLRTNLGSKDMRTTAYRSQTTKQVEFYNKTVVTRLHHNVVTYQRDRDLFVQPLTYAYNTQVLQSINTIYFSVLLTKHLLLLTVFDNQSALSTDSSYATDPQTLRTQFVSRIEALQTLFNKRFDSVQEKYRRENGTKVCGTPKLKPTQIV